MAFKLKNVVPWGRTFAEYKRMFALSEADLNKKIISFGDGPASFNSEMTKRNKQIISIDPVYRFSESEIRQRINETKDVVIEQTKNNADNFVWKQIKTVDELINTRLSAMDGFLSDFEKGKAEGRYINHELPQNTNFKELSFDLGLSSHFLILYDQLGVDFHIAAISEMLRVAKEIRIFPILTLDAKKSEILDLIINHFSSDYDIEIKSVDYEFQKNGNKMLVIKKQD